MSGLDGNNQSKFVVKKFWIQSSTIYFCLLRRKTTAKLLSPCWVIMVLLLHRLLLFITRETMKINNDHLRHGCCGLCQMVRRLVITWRGAEQTRVPLLSFSESTS